jgi:hypothetical protein
MFNLHQLGWYNFQLLASSIAREVFGQTAETFRPSKDAGKDGTFVGIFETDGRIKMQGKFVFQCKFTSKAGHNLALSDLATEFDKIATLVRENQCDNYILFTNAGVSGNIRPSITEKLVSLGVKEVLVYGEDWIIAQIKENKRLRALVPRIYGLGDLSEILDERAYSQGRKLLDYLRHDLSKVVRTSTYLRALNALDKHGFVLLLGAPAAGKTTIASLLALTALDQWETPTMKLDTAAEVVEHWNSNHFKQFIWIDDAFGSTQHESNLTQQWNYKMPMLNAMIQDGVRIVMTSRDYIYEEARKKLKESVFPKLMESQVVIDVHQLTVEEKAQILYNHIKMGDQPKKFKVEIKPFLEEITNMTEFLPETARRLGNRILTEGLYISQYHLIQFVKEQRAFFLELLEKLAQSHFAALALIYINNGQLESPIEFKGKQSKLMERIGGSVNACGDALSNMNESIVRLISTENGSYWTYKHPTIGDAISELIMTRPELIEFYLHGCETEQLLRNITCGNVGLKNALVIPSKFHSLVLKRMHTFRSARKFKQGFINDWWAQRTLCEFLAERCNESFLKRYVNATPQIFEIISEPTTYIQSSPELKVASRCFSLGILPAKFRKKVVQQIINIAKTGTNIHILELHNIRSFFNAYEIRKLNLIIQKDVAPNIDSILKNYQQTFNIDEDDAAYHMHEFRETLRILEKHCPGSEDLAMTIESTRLEMTNWISENTKSKDDTHRLVSIHDSDISEVQSERNIFEDVDE